MSAAVSMHEALFGRGVGAGAPLYQTFNAVVGASGLGVVNVPPLPAGTLIKVILPVNKGVWSGSAAGFSGGGSVSNMAGPNPPTNAADLSWATQVVTPQNTLASAHALQLDSVRTKPATGEYWLVSDGSQAEAIFTWADVATWHAGSGGSFGYPSYGPTQRVNVNIAAAPYVPPQLEGIGGRYTPPAKTYVPPKLEGIGGVVQQTSAATVLSSLVGGASAGIGAVAFPLQQGQRYSLQIKSNSGALPSGFGSPSNQLSIAALQAQLNAAGVQSTVVSVKYAVDGTTLILEEDHCGPTTSTSNPFVSPDGSVTTTYQGMPGAQCGAIAPAGWSGTKKLVVFGGGAVVLAAVVAAGTKAAGLW